MPPTGVSSRASNCSASAASRCSVGSSSSTTGARCSSARASNSRRRCPPLIASAPPVSTVSRPSGRPATHSLSPTAPSAARISSSVTSPRATRRFSPSVVEKMCASSAK
ncbi:Uncharacterised protein [Mycobacteroides abscessus subsp. abscessus]|nr:Uncharacterised protein [Mycobacteroides abscessus subsp. abscessus]